MSTDNTETIEPTTTTESATTAESATTTESATTAESKTSTQPTGARDTIYIGKKPLMAYVTSTLIQLANIPSVSIKARGMSISRAVDVAQIISRKTENAGYKIGNINISSEALESQDGKTRNVSTIEIEVKRNQ